MHNRYLIFLLFFAFGCAKQMSVEEIINRSIEASGGQKVFNSIIEFDFRDKHFTAKYHNYSYQLERRFSDSTGHIVDRLNNDSFTRTLNDSLVTLSDKWSGLYSSSVNSVIYFFRIPFILKDGAVKPKLIGTSSINDQQYYKVRVLFDEQGGGNDFDDDFIYWINQETFYVDYLAYAYSTNGGGKRFRKAINTRFVNGLRTVDYINYKPKNLDVGIEDYDNYFLDDGMEELSRIENTNVSIEYLE